MAKHKRTGSQPKGLGRGERGDRRSNRQPRVTRTESEWDNTGTFGASYDSRTVACSASDTNGTQYGISDAVVRKTAQNRREAAREMRRWMRTLPKGVKI